MDFDQLVKAALDAPSFHEEADFIEKACAGASTREQWETLLYRFDEKQIGAHVSDWADESAYHPCESSGASVLYFPDAEEPFSVAATWSDSGFWNVEIGSIEEAEKYIARLNEEWAENEEENEEEEEGEGK